MVRAVSLSEDLGQVLESMRLLSAEAIWKRFLAPPWVRSYGETPHCRARDT